MNKLPSLKLAAKPNENWCLGDYFWAGIFSEVFAVNFREGSRALVARIFFNSESFRGYDSTRASCSTWLKQTIA